MDKIFYGVNDLTVGQQAALRRSAGRSLKEADAMALQAFFAALPPQRQWEQERAFTTACIMCLWKPEERVSAVPFAKCLGALRRLKAAEGTKGLDSRFRSIIDTPWNDDDGYLATKLVRLAKMLKSSAVGYPDPDTLYYDLKNLEHPDRFVQRRWMEQYLVSDEIENYNDQEEN